MKQIIPALILLLLAFTVNAQDSTGTAEKKEKKFRFLPLPAFAVTPTTGWMIGVAPGAYWMMGDASNTSLSNALGTAIFTQKKQILFTLKANTFFAGDRWNMLTDIRYFINSQPTYGLGTGPPAAKSLGKNIGLPDDYPTLGSKQMMEFNYLRIYNTLLKRYKDTRFFYGLGYHLDFYSKIQDNLLNLDTVPPIITSHYEYSISNDFDPEEYWLSGVSFNLLYDSRDNAVNPYSGRYALANIRVNPAFLGSTKGSTMLWLEYRDYFHLSENRPRHLIGFWGYGWFQTSGTLPYMTLPAVGWDQFGRSGRAYTQGRFRGQDLIYTELEYRVPLQREKDMFGAVLFVNGTTATNREAGISLYEYMDFGYGVGLRIMIMKKSRANLSLDYAWGEYGAKGFYFGLNEAF
ncbi:BamA/TamA family outer membrane protein [Fulvivirga sedimenti]|uniref:Outer membrane protein assembly factor n=1 Tax=Fulvivirga sedimenti TaxID=2879465 RepID=A0A9X1L038_9BACT|nr:BamA/TamA family outer membrane protein [Fulvivirga sedimenti]MCA6079055.1 outer membrane protein assembly factor [Fulvivirga sedimenti]